MAIIPENEFAGKIDPADSEYPLGKARNVSVSGDGTGTPWNETYINDDFGFKQALLEKGQVTPNSAPDTAENSQYLRAMQNVTSVALADMSNVQDIDDDNLVNSVKFTMRGWHPGSSVGGGGFHYDPTIPKSNHDGGRYISTTVPWTLTTPDFTNGVGETDPGGTGVLVRDVSKGRVDFADYGVKYDYLVGPNTGTDNQVMFQAALNSGCKLRKSGTFMTGPVVTIAPANTDIEGDGVSTIYQTERISHYFSNHNLRKWRSIRRVGAATSVSGTRWWAEEFDSAASNWRSEDCYWEGYFYAEDLRGHLTDPAKRLDNVVRLYNEGHAPTGQNAGVFQQSRVDNFLCVKLYSYGGAGATGLNFVGENKDGMLIDLWEDGTNTYGGCEIENCPESNIKIIGGTFQASLWLDDTSDIDVIGADINWLRMTAQTEVTKNINITDCDVKTFHASQFGGAPTEALDEVTLDNVRFATPASNPQTRAIWLPAVKKITLRNIKIDPANYTEDLRFNAGFSGFDMELTGLRSDNRVFVDGSGGTVTAYDNEGLRLLDVNNAKGLERTQTNFGVYSGTGSGFASYVGLTAIPTATTGTLDFKIPGAPGSACRAFTLLVNNRSSSGATTAEMINGIITNVGSVILSSAYGTVGVPDFTILSGSWAADVLSISVQNTGGAELRLTGAINTTITQAEV